MERGGEDEDYEKSEEKSPTSPSNTIMSPLVKNK
jgi:hypothetical protein